MDVESELNQYHVSLTSIKESVDTSNSTGKMVFQLFGMIAEWERETIIERVKSGRIQRYKDGCWAGGKPPFGYAYDKTSRKLVINEAEARIVRFIFNQYNSGKSLAAMNALLDAERVPTIRGKARGWIDAGIRFILVNPVYKGTLIVNRQCHITNIDKVDLSKAIIIKVPPIVSESVWDLAQSHLESHKKIRPPRKNKWLLQGILTCGLCGLSYQGQHPSLTSRCYSCRGRLKESHTDGSPRCSAPTLPASWLEDEVWIKLADILRSPDKLTSAIKDSLENLKERQAELDLILKPINEKLAQISIQKAKLADEWVVSNMDPDKYRELQFTLNKEEMRLKSIRANMEPARIVELESITQTLEYWQTQFQSPDCSTESDHGGLKLLEKTKPAIKIYGFEDINLTESLTSPTLQRQILDKIQVKLVVFNDRIEVKCQIPIEPNKSANIILSLGLDLALKHHQYRITSEL